MQWLNVHPLNLCGDDDWAVVRMARNWRDGMMPEGGGASEQAAWTVAAIEIVLATWQKMQAAADERNRPRR